MGLINYGYPSESSLNYGSGYYPEFKHDYEKEPEGGWTLIEIDGVPTKVPTSEVQGLLSQQPIETPRVEPVIQPPVAQVQQPIQQAPRVEQPNPTYEQQLQDEYWNMYPPLTDNKQGTFTDMGSTGDARGIMQDWKAEQGARKQISEAEFEGAMNQIGMGGFLDKYRSSMKNVENSVDKLVNDNTDDFGNPISRNVSGETTYDENLRNQNTLDRLMMQDRDVANVANFGYRSDGTPVWFDPIVSTWPITPDMKNSSNIRQREQYDLFIAAFDEPQISRYQQALSNNNYFDYRHDVGAMMAEGG